MRSRIAGGSRLPFKGSIRISHVAATAAVAVAATAAAAAAAAVAAVAAAAAAAAYIIRNSCPSNKFTQISTHKATATTARRCKKTRVICSSIAEHQHLEV